MHKGEGTHLLPFILLCMQTTYDSFFFSSNLVYYADEMGRNKILSVFVSLKTLLNFASIPFFNSFAAS